MKQKGFDLTETCEELKALKKVFDTIVEMEKWSGDRDKILIEPNGKNIKEITEELNRLLGEQGEKWRFLTIHPHLHTNPPIEVKNGDRDWSIRVLEANSLLRPSRWS